jgi:hypothetical protein
MELHLYTLNTYLFSRLIILHYFFIQANYISFDLNPRPVNKYHLNLKPVEQLPALNHHKK